MRRLTADECRQILRGDGYERYGMERRYLTLHPHFGGRCYNSIMLTHRTARFLVSMRR